MDLGRRRTFGGEGGYGEGSEAWRGKEERPDDGEKLDGGEEGHDKDSGEEHTGGEDCIVDSRGHGSKARDEAERITEEAGETGQNFMRRRRTTSDVQHRPCA